MCMKLVFSDGLRESQLIHPAISMAQPMYAPMGTTRLLDRAISQPIRDCGIRGVSVQSLRPELSRSGEGSPVCRRQLIDRSCRGAGTDPRRRNCKLAGAGIVNSDQSNTQQPVRVPMPSACIGFDVLAASAQVVPRGSMKLRCARFCTGSPPGMSRFDIRVGSPFLVVKDVVGTTT